MTWPLILASGAAILFQSWPKKSSREGTMSPSITERNIVDQRSVLTGVVAGIGIGYFLAHEIRRNRLFERLRVGWFWLNQDEVQLPSKDLMNLAYIRTMVTPKNSRTADMHVSLLTLGPKTEMTTAKAHGVEFYYILQGTCTLSVQEQDDIQLNKGEFIVLDPWVIRSIANRGYNEVLVLRTTDGGSHYDKEGYDKVNADTISTSTSAAVVSYGLKQLGSLFSSIWGGSMS